MEIKNNMKHKFKRHDYVKTRDGNIFIVEQVFNDIIRTTNMKNKDITYLDPIGLVKLKEETVKVLYGNQYI